MVFRIFQQERHKNVGASKQTPWMGLWCKKATPNLAHTRGVLSLFGVLAFIILIAIAIAAYAE
jgi:hypothetical protein